MTTMLKAFFRLNAVIILLSLFFNLAVLAGIIYFIVFACTHWLRW